MWVWNQIVDALANNIIVGRKTNAMYENTKVNTMTIIFSFLGNIAEDILDTDLILRSFGISDAYTQAPNFSQVTQWAKY